MIISQSKWSSLFFTSFYQEAETVLLNINNKQLWSLNDIFQRQFLKFESQICTYQIFKDHINPTYVYTYCFDFLHLVVPVYYAYLWAGDPVVPVALWVQIIFVLRSWSSCSGLQSHSFEVSYLIEIQLQCE